MSTISFKMLDSELLPLKENPNNRKARLFAEVSQFLIDFTKKYECNSELYKGMNSCDSVCMACVLDETMC
jgi:hypothetical protein